MPLEPTSLSAALKIGSKIATATYKIFSSWKEKAEKEAKADIEKAIEKHTKQKGFFSNIADTLSKALQTLHLSPEGLESLRGIDSDQVLHQEMAALLASGQLSPELLENILRKSLGDTTRYDLPLATITSLWLDAIQMTIGEFPALAHAVQIKSLVRIEAAIESGKATVDEILSETTDIRKNQHSASVQGTTLIAHSELMIEMIRTLTAQVAENSQLTPVRTSLDQQFQKRFEKARQLLLFGSVKSAEIDFLELINDLLQETGSVVRDLLLRSYLNYSSSLLMQAREVEAAEALQQARQISPDDSRLRRHEAMLLYYKGDKEHALSIVQSLQKNEPNEIKHITHEIAILQDLNKDEELKKVLSRDDFDDADYLCQKSYALLHLGEFNDAQKAASKAVELQPESEGPWMAMAYSKGFPVVEKIDSDKSIGPTLDQLAELDEAIKAALRADQILAKRERTGIREDLQANLLAFYAKSNRNAEALQLARSIKLDAALPEMALMNMYCTFVRNNHPQQALQVANAMIEVENSQKHRLQKANALLMDGKYELVISECESEKKLSPSNDIDSEWIAMAARAHYGLHRIEIAIRLLEDGLKCNENICELHLELADLLAESGKLSEAREHYVRAENLDGGNSKAVIYFALFLYGNNQWSEALSRFERVGSRSPASQFFKKMLVCYYNLADYGQCLDLVSEWQLFTSDWDETVFAIGARSAFHTEEIQTAQKFLEELIRRGAPEDAPQRKMLAQIYLRLDELDQSYTLLSKVVVDHPDDEDAITLLAQVCSALGKHEKALEYHVNAIRLSPSKIQNRSAFFGTMLALPETFTPTDDQIKMHHENISILTSDGSGVLRQIQVIKDDESIDISELKIELEKKEASVKSVLEDLDKTPLPLVVLAENLGASIYDTWSNLTMDAKRGIFMCLGSEEAQASQTDLARTAQSVCVDLIALFTLQKLGLLHILPSLYKDVYIHVSSLDFVVSELRSMRHFHATGRIASIEGKIILEESNAEMNTYKISALTQIRDFVKSSGVKIVGLRGALQTALFPIDNQRLRRLVLPSLVAKERGSFVFSDDQMFRLFSSQLAPQSFCTQAFLRSAHSHKFINNEQYQDHVLMLISLNYHFVSYDVYTLIRLFQKTSGPPPELAEHMYNFISRPNWATKSSRLVLVEFFIFLWNRSPGLRGISESWAEKLWIALLAADKSMRFAFDFIADLGLILLGRPQMFGAIVEWMLERAPTPRANRLRLFRSALEVAKTFAAGNHGIKSNNQLWRSWRVQKTTLEMLKILSAKNGADSAG